MHHHAAGSYERYRVMYCCVTDASVWGEAAPPRTLRAPWHPVSWPWKRYMLCGCDLRAASGFAALLHVQAIDGDVLVFLPGWDEISTLKDSLEAATSPFRSQLFMVLPLHSQIAPEEQKRVFQV